MSTKAETLGVAVRPRVRTWVAPLLIVAFLAAVAVALMFRPTSTASGGSGGSQVTTTQQVGGDGPLQYHPLP